ncbi:MAG: hypothetical protein U0271_19600 [Polyangiaceae bacterium]
MTGRSCNVAAVVAAVGVLGAPAEVSANGRFPAAQQLVVSPSDPDRIAVQVTYGFLESFDRGATFSWTCEEAALYSGEFDPPIALLSGSTLIAGTPDGVVHDAQDACSFAAGAGLEGHFIADVSASRAQLAGAIAMSVDQAGAAEFDTRLWTTSDGGLTWAALGGPLATDFRGLTVDAAPSDEAILYVSGLRVSSDGTGKGQLAVSGDNGDTWAYYPVPTSNELAAPYIGAISPTDPNSVWVRLAGNGGLLYRTRNGAVGFERVFDGLGPLLALALSPDGSTVVVGGEVDGLLSADTTEAVFSPVSSVPARCATWTSEGLYVCADEGKAGFTLGLSTDGGATLTPLYRQGCLTGPTVCETPLEACEARWTSQSQLLGSCEQQGDGGAGGAGTSEPPTDDVTSGCSFSRGSVRPPRFALPPTCSPSEARGTSTPVGRANASPSCSTAKDRERSTSSGTGAILLVLLLRRRARR